MFTIEELLESTDEQFDSFAVGMKQEVREGGHFLDVSEVACLVLHHHERIKEMQETIDKLTKQLKWLDENKRDAGFW